MPQVRIEFSDGALAPETARAMAFELHHALAPVLDTDVASFKTRLVCLEAVAIGPAPSPEGMIHVELGVLSGRSGQTKARAADLTLGLVQAALGQSRRPLQITVEVRDMDASTYRKALHGRS